MWHVTSAQHFIEIVNTGKILPRSELDSKFGITYPQVGTNTIYDVYDSATQDKIDSNPDKYSVIDISSEQLSYLIIFSNLYSQYGNVKYFKTDYEIITKKLYDTLAVDIINYLNQNSYAIGDPSEIPLVPSDKIKEAINNILSSGTLQVVQIILNIDEKNQYGVYLSKEPGSEYINSAPTGGKLNKQLPNFAIELKIETDTDNLIPNQMSGPAFLSYFDDTEAYKTTLDTIGEVIQQGPIQLEQITEINFVFKGAYKPSRKGSGPAFNKAIKELNIQQNYSSVQEANQAITSLFDRYSELMNSSNTASIKVKRLIRK